ncbi:hypothetical protein MBLNU459_g2220t1 [Dothideomycetes sp. NU459]
MSQGGTLDKGRTAFITGQLLLLYVQVLVDRGASVYIADLDLYGAQSVAEELGASSGSVATAIEVDVCSWESQLSAFKKAVKLAGRLDYVFPIAGIGEKQYIPNDPAAEDFAKPNLAVLDADLNGVLYTVALAIQQFRRQDKDADGFRGKIGCVASVCGFYCVPTLPIYTAAKHGLTGFVRSYGKHLPEEGITLNAVSPSVVRTSISQSWFYDQVEEAGLLTSMDGVIEAFESFLGTSDTSGEIFEVGPNGGFVRRAPPEHLDEESRKVCETLHERGRPLHAQKS